MRRNHNENQKMVKINDNKIISIKTWDIIKMADIQMKIYSFKYLYVRCQKKDSEINPRKVEGRK